MSGGQDWMRHWEESEDMQSMPCQLSRNNPQPAVLHPRKWPQWPWARVHVDYAGLFMGKISLCWSMLIPNGWISTWFHLPQHKWRLTFATFPGLPEVLVIDNGTPGLAHSQLCNRGDKNVWWLLTGILVVRWNAIILDSIAHISTEGNLSYVFCWSSQSSLISAARGFATIMNDKLCNRHTLLKMPGNKLWHRDFPLQVVISLVC